MPDAFAARPSLPTRVAALLALTPMMVAAAHPMDPLSADEMLGAADLLLQRGAARPGAVFQSIELREPGKQQVLNARRGTAAADRMATVFYRQNKRSYKTIVNLSAGTFTPPALIPPSEGQLGLTITEVSDFAFVFQDRAFVAALAQRGITGEQQLKKVFVTPLTPGSFGLPEESRRIVKAQMYYTEGGVINLYARPIEGLQAIIDLDERRIVKLLDSGVVPIPASNHNFDEASVGASIGLRPELRPIRISQPLGANFRIDGNFIEWQKWRFHARFEKRSGPVISLVTYDRRQVMYQGSLAEIFVPYQDPFLGVFAVETSAYSRLTEWPGGGKVGIHGTSRPDLLGQAVSHGCIRVANATAEALKRFAPLGTPITVLP